MGYLDKAGLSRAFTKLKTLIDNKADVGHTHTKSQITDFAHTHDDRYYTESEINSKIAAETKARTDADTSIDTAYKAADTALGSRIDNAETEISANSADLTGIKGLTYGPQHVNFLEVSNGEYSSPALDEIAEQIAQGMTCIQIQSDATTMDAETLNKLSSNWPNVALIDTTPDPNDSTHNFKFPVRKSNSHYRFIAIGGHYREGHPYATNIVIKKTGEITRQDVTNDPYWSNITGKPFSTIGTGLKVVSDALTVDTSALPSGLTTIAVSETSTAADVYAKAQAAWPNCVLSGDTLYYPYAEAPEVGSQAHAYLFTANGGALTSAWIVNATSMTYRSDIIVTVNTTWGDIEHS